MQEVFPVVAGVLVGFAAQRVHDERWRTVFVVALALIFGAAATFISGEWLISWLFIGVDTLLVFLGAAAVTIFFFGREYLGARQARERTGQSHD